MKENAAAHYLASQLLQRSHSWPFLVMSCSPATRSPPALTPSFPTHPRTHTHTQSEAHMLFQALMCVSQSCLIHWNWHWQPCFSIQLFLSAFCGIVWKANQIQLWAMYVCGCVFMCVCVCVWVWGIKWKEGKPRPSLIVFLLNIRTNLLLPCSVFFPSFLNYSLCLIFGMKCAAVFWSFGLRAHELDSGSNKNKLIRQINHYCDFDLMKAEALLLTKTQRYDYPDFVSCAGLL